MTGVRVDEIADFMDLRGMKNSLAVFYSTFCFTPFENGDVLISSQNEPRIVLIPYETQTDAFRAALQRKLDALPPPHYDRVHPLGSDLMLAKMAPKMMLMTRVQYTIWAMQRTTQALSHAQNDIMQLSPCEVHELREEAVGESETTETAKAKKRNKKKKKKTKGIEEEGGNGTETAWNTPPSSAWSTEPNTPASLR